MNGVNKLIVNKVDILEKVEEFKILRDGATLSFSNKYEFEQYIRKEAYKLGAVDTYFSYSPYDCKLTEDKTLNDLRSIDRHMG